MRKIYCEACGVVKPTHPEDAALGLFPRRTHGQTINDLVCDGCGKEMPAGSKAVAESLPSRMSFWEWDYLEGVEKAVNLSQKCHQNSDHQ